MDNGFSPADILELERLGEYLAAGCLEYEGTSLVRRSCHGLRRSFERAPLPEWQGEPLYPCGKVDLPRSGKAVVFSYTDSVLFNRAVAEELYQDADGRGRLPLKAGESIHCIFGRDKREYLPEYALGGGGFTHSIVNYGRVLRQGLEGYAARLSKAAGRKGADPDFYAGLEELIQGLRSMQARIIEMIASRPELPNGDRLYAALQRVPFQPARSFYEAMVAVNLLWYIDGHDNLGRFDQDLGPYLEADLSAKRISRAEAAELVKLLFRNIDVNGGWNVAIGGTGPDGRDVCNVLTEVCLECIAGMRRPNLALRIGRDTPDAVMELAMDAIASGCGMPALYNEEAYLKAVPKVFGDMGEDLYSYTFGGCTETMVHGCSNVGSIDGGINLVAVLERSVRESLAGAADFDDFLNIFLGDMKRTIAAAASWVNGEQQRKADWQPQPLRSLLIDDCLDRGLDFNAGGARYNGGVFNIGGLANVVDSLAVLRDLVFTGEIDRTKLLQALEADFQGYEELWRAVNAEPHYGNDLPAADDLAARVAAAVFAEVRGHKSWRGGTPFLPSCIMFTTYAWAGQSVGATPDGRRAATPVVDSIGPMFGRDKAGPTAMLRSVCSLPLDMAIGTPILNVRFSRSIFSSPEGREKFKALLRAYFDMGGMQMQVTVADQETLRRAMEHPEDYENLIIRIGGYSEYFNNLTPELKKSVMERTEHR